KLAARAQTGRWVGWDEATDAHRIYWPDRRIVTVERSVRFKPDDNNVEVELEGEQDQQPEGKQNETYQQNSELAPTTSPVGADADPTTPAGTDADPTTPSTDGLLHDPAGLTHAPVATSGRPRRVRKESDYVRRLRSGEGSTDGRGRNTLPRGMSSATL
ncbi:hypothetical protein BD310DRAFT_787087, partial [Dichomitus squalens]